VIEVLLYPDEIRKHTEHKLNSKVTEKELAVADHLVDLMSGEFEPEKYTDHYREALSELLHEKLDGAEETDEEIKRPRGGGQVLDLMAALQASLDSAKGSSKSGKKAKSESDTSTIKKTPRTVKSSKADPERKVHRQATKSQSGDKTKKAGTRAPLLKSVARHK
jgi:DNA end-binding protein Ku